MLLQEQILLSSKSRFYKRIAIFLKSEKSFIILEDGRLYNKGNWVH